MDYEKISPKWIGERNKYIKACDKHNIADGVLREMLWKINMDNSSISIQAIREAILKRENEIAFLMDLEKQIKEDSNE